MLKIRSGEWRNLFHRPQEEKASTLLQIKTWFLWDSRLSSLSPDYFKIESFSLLLDIVAYCEQKTLIVQHVTFCLTEGNKEQLLCLWISHGAGEDNKKMKWDIYFFKGKWKKIIYEQQNEWLPSLASPSFCYFLNLTLVALWYDAGGWGWAWERAPTDWGRSAPARPREPRRTALLIPGRRRLCVQHVLRAGPL